MLNIKRVAICLAIIVLAVFGSGRAVQAQEAPRIGKDALRAMLGSPDLLLLDVRTPHDWDAGNLKIKGAVRSVPAQFDATIDKLPRDKTIVLYCA